MIADALGLVLLNALFLAAGVGVTAVAGWWRGGRALVRSVGVSYLVGVAAYGVVAQALYVCGASLARWQVVACCLLGASGVLVAAGPGPMLPQIPSSRWRYVAIPVCAMLALIAIDLWFQPLWAYDAWTFWTPKAHALWALDGLRPNWFTSADLISRDYPILLPAVEAAGFRFTGYEVALLDVQSLLFFAAFLRAIYEVCAPRARPVVLWGVLAMLVFAPSVTDQLAAAEADIPVAVFFALAGLCALVWLRDRSPAALVVSAVLAAGASATKVEGLEFTLALFAVLTLAVAVAVGGSRRVDALAALAAGVAAVVVGVVPWRIWLSRHGIPNQGSVGRAADVAFLTHHVSRVPVAGGYLLVKLLDPRAWLLTVPLFAAVAGWRYRIVDRRGVSFVLGTALTALAGLLVAYWSTRLGVHYQLATSARRVVTGVVFFCAATTPLLSEPA